MPKKAKEDILREIEANGIHFIRLQFTDIFGTMKNVSITVSQIEKALENKIMFDGSSIEGFVRIEESDMYLRPDFDTFTILPWRTQVNVARLICDVYTPEGEPFAGDPRYVLKRALKQAEDMGFEFNVGPECEFFLMNLDENGKPTLETQDHAGYFDLAPSDLGENARRDICIALEKMGFEIEASHHEVARGQHEIDFKYADAMTSADNIMTFKLAVRSIAKSHGLYATFMPKPIYGIAGSGMHCNMSLFKNGKNAFYDENDKNKLSKTAYHFIAGLMEHARGMALITNPLVNSYKRLVAGYEAPIYIAWSCKNRSPLIRIPTARGLSTRIEMRNPDPACNPYLALAALLTAGLDGVRRELTPPGQVSTNIFELTEEQRKAAGILCLPKNLEEAIEEFDKDELVKSAMGGHVSRMLVEAKKSEWEDYRKQVHKWEIDSYLWRI